MVSGEAMACLQLSALTVALSWGLTGLATFYATRRGMLDHPGERHSHRSPTPRGGGAGLVSAVVLVSLLPWPAAAPDYWIRCVVPGVAAMALLGWWDDHRSLSVRFRLAVQLAVIIWLLVCASTQGWVAGAPVIMICGVFIAWMTNLYNFMDGSNGMAGSQGVYGGLVLAWLFDRSGQAGAAVPGLILAAASAGFLPWNLGRARVFMGDVGSLALGFAFAALLVRGVLSGVFSVPVGLMVMAVFLADSTATLVARVMKGERWYNPHRQHLYQRLIAHGWSHGRVALVYQTVNLALVVPGIGVAVHYPAYGWPVALVLAAVLAFGWFGLTRKFGVLAQAG